MDGRPNRKNEPGFSNSFKFVTQTELWSVCKCGKTKYLVANRLRFVKRRGFHLILFVCQLYLVSISARII